jgi:hypothetical protein
MTEDMTYILKITYNHPNASNYERGLIKSPNRDFKNKKVHIPFGIYYPVYWMKLLFESAESSNTIKDICSDADMTEIKFKKTQATTITRKHYEQHLENIEYFGMGETCYRCHRATVNFCDKLYSEMLSAIKNSVMEFILSFSKYSHQKDIAKIIGKMLWETKHQIIWLRLKPV